MNERLRTPLVVGAVLAVFAIAAVGYAAAQTTNTTNSTVPGGTPGGVAPGHVCPHQAGSAAAPTPIANASGA